MNKKSKKAMEDLRNCVKRKNFDLMGVMFGKDFSSKKKVHKRGEK